jgi:dihydrofolate reductase
VTQLVRVHNFGVSRDGYAAGEGQSLEHPFGDVNPMALLGWIGSNASWVNRTEPGGRRGIEDYLARDFHRNIGAEIMGRNKFGPQRGPWTDHEWQGWWGDEPPFHTPVFVMTHHERPSFTLADTIFHFVAGEPAAVLEQALAAAEGQDVRIGGGAETVRQFLDAGLVDTLHVSVSPLEIGGGSRLWESPDELLDRYHRDVVPGSDGVVHHLFWRD